MAKEGSTEKGTREIRRVALAFVNGRDRERLILEIVGGTGT